MSWWTGQGAGSCLGEDGTELGGNERSTRIKRNSSEESVLRRRKQKITTIFYHTETTDGISLPFIPQGLDLKITGPKYFVALWADCAGFPGGF